MQKNYKEELEYLKKLKQIVDDIPEFPDMDYIKERIRILEKESVEDKR